jgi:S1-C subfamily serine protease
MKKYFKKFVLFIILILLSHPSVGAMISNQKIVITTNILQRVFFLKYKDSTGTAFTVDVDGKQYLITAKHVVDGIMQNDLIEIFYNNRWKKIKVKPIKCGNDQADIIVLIIPFSLSPPFEIIANSEGMFLSQDMYFLGYPYQQIFEDNGVNRNFPLPFVKKGILSATTHDNEGNLIIYLDGHNNPGFSGGPIVFQNIEEDKLHIAGVISAYRTQYDPVIVNGTKTGLAVMSNAGIVLGYDIKPAIDAIKKNSIGGLICPKR